MPTRVSARKLPLFPCLCVGLGLVLLGVTIGTFSLPDADKAFVGAQAERPQRFLTQMQAKKLTVRDRGTQEYKDQMKLRGQIRTATWEAFENQGWENVGVSSDDIAKRFEQVKARDGAKAGGGGGAPSFQMPSFEMPSFSAPSMPSMPSMPAPAPAPAPSGAPAPGPFDWLIQLFQPTTTTTTTTLDPVSAFFKGLR